MEPYAFSPHLYTCVRPILLLHRLQALSAPKYPNFYILLMFSTDVVYVFRTISSRFYGPTGFLYMVKGPAADATDAPQP